MVGAANMMPSPIGGPTTPRSAIAELTAMATSRVYPRPPSASGSIGDA